MISNSLTRSESLKLQTQRRNEAIHKRFSELYETRIDGMRLSVDSIIEKLANEFYLSIKTVEKILRKK